MGELSDPFDEEEYEIIKKKDGTTIVDGSIKIYDLLENFDIKFPQEREYDTLAGFILDVIGDTKFDILISFFFNETLSKSLAN